MPSSGPNYPGTAASLANAGTSENSDAWTNTGNIVSDNGTEASITAATYDSPDISQLLVASNFGFAIPAGSTIDGITVEIDRRDGGIGAASDNRVQLATGTTFADLVGTNKAATTTDWPTASAVATYGGAADTWAAGLTAAQVNAAGFAVMLSVQADAANTDIFVDYIRVTIAYTEPSPSGSGALSIPAATVSGTGSHAESPSGTGAIAVGTPVLAGTGVLTLTATGAVVAGPPAVSGSGVETFTATGATTAPAATADGSGTLGFTGTGAATSAAPAVAGAGDHTSSGAEPSGSGAPAAPAATVAGSGVLTFTATGAVGAPAVTAVGSGALVLTGSGAVSVPVALIVGAGAEAFTGTGAAGGTAPTVAGVGSAGSETVGGLPPSGQGSSFIPAGAAIAASLTPSGTAYHPKPGA